MIAVAISAPIRIENERFLMQAEVAEPFVRHFVLRLAKGYLDVETGRR